MNDQPTFSAQIVGQARRAFAQDVRAWAALGVPWGTRTPPRAVASQAVEVHAPEPALPEPVSPKPVSSEPKETGPMPRPTPTQAPARVPKKAQSTAASVSGDASPAAQALRLLDEILEDYKAAAPHRATGTPHTTIVFGEGDPCARIMFVGEAPGADEDRLGRPFVGRAGQLLDQMIVAMGLKREEVYIANVLKVRPPNNATPTVEEALASAPFLLRQVEVVSPEAIVALGLPSARLLTGQTLPMGQLRGQWWPMRTPSEREFQVLPTYHPAYLLRNYTPDARRKVWEDLKLVLERLGLPVPQRGGG